MSKTSVSEPIMFKQYLAHGAYETNILIGCLIEAIESERGIITYDELSQKANVDVQKRHRSKLESAKRFVEANYNVMLSVINRTGYRIVRNPESIIEEVTAKRQGNVTRQIELWRNDLHRVDPDSIQTEEGRITYASAVAKHAIAANAVSEETNRKVEDAAKKYPGLHSKDWQDNLKSVIASLT